ncbi:S1 family peptidase [Streptomyces sp. NPDC054884]|uniref:S1 family peptidase n=1 Tax=Streptomyces sp. ME08-AFT2 TaxID=3028683 RepID=UPI0029B1E04F|nr:S1 family peptidase [Streptomyces sp. ME08-AFT2]MDX3315215.1 S1 family peptidase [Streptomyces sp. ME08-AFT2]
MYRAQSGRLIVLAAATALVAVPLALSTAAPASALAGSPATETTYASTVKLDIGDTFRSCTGTLVNAQWVLTASSCFADDPAAGFAVAAGKPKWKTTATVGRTHLDTTAGQVREVVDLVPRSDRDLVLAKLATPVRGIAPLRVGTTPPTATEQLKGAGYGRTKDTWVPNTPHTGSFTVNRVDATQLQIDGTPVCKGDTGAPVFREKNGVLELAAVATASWQGGCLGTSETRTGAVATRVDDLGAWVRQSTASTLTPWRLQLVTVAGKDLYHSVKDSNWDWTAFGAVEQAAGGIGDIEQAADAGISGTNTVLALGADGVIYETKRSPNGAWVPFRSLTAELGSLAGLKKISVTSMGSTLGLVGIAGGRVYHSVRDTSGKWIKWGDVSAAAGPLTAPTDITITKVGDTTHIGVIANTNKAYHVIRDGLGNWGSWGEITKITGAPTSASALAFAGTGTNDLQVVLVAPGGVIKHAARLANGNWTTFGDLDGSVLGTGPVTAVSAATVDNEFHTAVIRNGAIKHTVRHLDGSWEPADTPPGAPANPTSLAVTGSLS